MLIDYRDFMLQGQLDIERAKDLFAREDYGFAAYSAQQGLEKYLKSYLMKLNIIKNPDVAGHLPYSTLLEIIVNEFDDLYESEKSDVLLSQYLQNCKMYFQLYKNVIDGFKKSTPKKILTWKSSLNMELNDEEKKIMDGIQIEYEKANSIMINGITTLFANDTGERPAIVNPEDQQRFIQWIVRNLENSQKNLPIDFTKEMDEAEAIISPYLYGTRKNSLSKKDSDFTTKFFKIYRTFSWLELIVASYPHEEIGRYPTDIDNESSLNLYKERKNDLYNLINTIDSTCLQIRTSILSMNF